MSARELAARGTGRTLWETRVDADGMSLVERQTVRCPPPPPPPPGTETGLNVKTETTEPSEEEQVKVETVAFLRHCCPVKMQSEPRVSFTVFSKVR